MGRQKRAEKKASQKQQSTTTKTRVAPSSSTETSTREKVKQLEREDSFVKDVVDPTEENKTKEQGHDLRVLVSQWVSSNTSKLKVISNEPHDAASSSDGENPVSNASA